MGKMISRRLVTERLFTRRSLFSFAVTAAVITSFVAGTLVHGGGARAAGLPYNSYQAFVAYIQAHHKAPFDHAIAAQLGQKNASALQKSRTVGRFSGGGTNVMVNQDRNPWPKAEIGAAVDPVTGKSYVVMSNDFRENYDRQFYHVSTNGGASFTDDVMAIGIDPNTGFVPFSFQSDPGVAFDSVGHSFLSTISGNLIFDFVNGYINLDTQIEVTTGFANGTYTSLLPIGVDTQPCNGTFSVFNCPAQLDKPFITVDNVPSSPHKGTIYVYYTIFCNGGPNGEPCVDGNATVPAFSSAILESHAVGADLPFSPPALVSGSLTNEQFSSLVVDNHGTPHIFFDDFTAPFPQVNMFESTLTSSGWVVSSAPVATFSYTGLNNINWGFRDFATVAPGCAIHGGTAYCAFSATQIGSGAAFSTPDVYVTRVNTATGASKIFKVNSDPSGASKHHFFPWASTAPSGAVYVGWYDDRNDPFSTKVQYFVGKSIDGGKTFPTQQAVNDVPFNPCVGFPGCGFFGDYTQIVTGPDGVTHAAWSDTRDGASMQIWSQAITW